MTVLMRENSIFIMTSYDCTDKSLPTHTAEVAESLLRYEQVLLTIKSELAVINRILLASMS
jgi:hypothetical protein